MDVSQAMDLGRDCLLQVLWLAGPLVGGVLVVGLVVGLLQAATQVQEPTLSFVPKAICVVALLIWLGPWLADQLIVYTQQLIRDIPNRL
jgi:flagellar biosynthetic protein FliQ